MHRHAGGLVDGDQVIVLEHHRKLASRHCRLGAAIGHPHRRHPHLVTQREPRVGCGAALVDAHLAGADDAIDMRLGHALEQLDQEVVEALPFRALVDLHPRHRGRRSRCCGACGLCRGRAFAPYNALHHVCDVSD